MNINELLVTSKSKQHPTDFMSDHKDKIRLSDFLQFPILDDSDSDNDGIELRELIGPKLNPIATELIARLVDASGTLEVLEVLHDVYRMYCDGDLIIDMEAVEWPSFWDEVLGSDDTYSEKDIV